MTLRGGPDYGVWAPKHTVTALVDLAELAARLQSPYLFDRRGDVVILDDFEASTLKWAGSLVGTGASVSLTTTGAFGGNQSVWLRSGAEPGTYTEMRRYVFEPESARCGMTVYFNTQHTGLALEIGMRLPHGDTVYAGCIRLSDSANAIQYLSSAGTWAAVDTLPVIPRRAHAFFPVKLVLDYDLLTYREFLLGPYSYDLSHLALFKDLETTVAFSHLHIKIISDPDGNREVWIDNFVFTRNEP